MARDSTLTGAYDLRVVILRRVVTGKGTNNEDIETWPDPTPGTNEYFAARIVMSAGETIAQGMREPLGSMKLKIKGRSIPVDTADRLKKKFTGEVFNVVGVMRDASDTILMVERLHQQAVAQ